MGGVDNIERITNDDYTVEEIEAFAASGKNLFFAITPWGWQ
jgi:hypothetical protein